MMGNAGEDARAPSEGIDAVELGISIRVQAMTAVLSPNFRAVEEVVSPTLDNLSLILLMSDPALWHHYRCHSPSGQRAPTQRVDNRQSGQFIHVEALPGVFTVIAGWMADT